MDEEVEGSVHTTKDDVSYDFESSSSLDDDKSSSSSDSAEVHNAIVQVHVDEEAVSNDFASVISLHDDNIANSNDREGTLEEGVETQDEKDGVSHLEDTNQTSSQLTDFEEFCARKEAVDCRIKALFARMDKSNEEHAIRMQTRQQLKMRAKINNHPKKKLDMSSMLSHLDESASKVHEEDEEGSCDVSMQGNIVVHAFCRYPFLSGAIFKFLINFTKF
ncbi:hypothetical protein M5689_018964 [Euphorbia peplus]|nr:hypothetical protein M5689_018964 [Euphorbia peplus]